jgi:hypothetical protein
MIGNRTLEVEITNDTILGVTDSFCPAGITVPGA